MRKIITIILLIINLPVLGTAILVGFSWHIIRVGFECAAELILTVGK